MGDGPGTGVRQWGPCSRVGEAGRPNGQRRSEMIATAVGVGGPALWHGHPAHRCQPSSVVRASGCRRSIFRVHLSSPLHLSVRAYSERERWAGRVRGRRTYPIPYRGPNQGRQWMTRVLGNCIRCLACAICVAMWCHSICRMDRDIAERTAVDIKAHTPLIRFVVICCTTSCGLVVDLWWTCWCAVLELVFVQNGERRWFGWRAEPARL